MVKVLPLYKEEEKNIDVKREWKGIMALQKILNTMKTKIWWEFSDRAVFGFEKLKIDVSDALNKRGFLTPEKKYIIAMQIAKTLKIMHDKDITHGDLKTENLMCEDINCNKVKLIDFGHVDHK